MAGTATAGSTNLILHLLAIAREAGIPESEFNIDVFDEVSRATPVIADLKPGGRFMAPDMSAAGGTPLLGRRLMEAGPDHGRRRPSPARACSRPSAMPAKRRGRR